MSRITTHVLDTSLGRPAAGVDVVLEYKGLDDWEEVLIKMMKRRRFHELFKGVRKIGKGNFASVYLT